MPAGWTFEQLDQVSGVNPTDLFCIERNGINYGVPASLIPTQIIGTIGFFNVQTYGAKGDGTTVNDSFINDTIAAAQAAGGGIVYFPQGNYLVSNAYSATLPTGVSLMGAGPGCTFITTASGAIATTKFSGASGSSQIFISGLSFVGNGVNPSPPPNAPPVIAFATASQIYVYNCTFSGNTGTCISFTGVTRAQVYGCYFSGTGYNLAGGSNALQNAAVFVDSTSVAVKVHHSDFVNCKYFGVQIMGTDCEVASNYLQGCYMAAIRVGQVSSSGQGNGCRVISNRVDTVHENQTDGSGGSGIYLEGTFNCLVQNNIVSTVDADGFVFASCQQFTCIGNIAYNCCQTGNQCGFQFNPQASSAPNTGGVFIGNVSYDNQGTPTQLCGLRVLGPGSGGAIYAVVIGNSFNGFTGMVGGSPQRGISATDAILDDDTNIVQSNTDWLDRIHLGVASNTVPASTTATGVGTPSGSVLGSATIEKGVMGLNRAVRLTAYGVATVATGVTFLLSYGSSLGNIVNFAESSAETGASWRLEMWMNSADNNNGQHFSYELYYHGALVSSGVGNLSVDSTVDEPLTLQATTQSGDSVTCQAFTLLRE